MGVKELIEAVEGSNIESEAKAHTIEIIKEWAKSDVLPVPAKTWRELGADDTLRSIEIAARVIEDELKGEALDEPSTLGRIMKLLDISAKFQEMAMSVLRVEEEKYAHL